MLRTICQTRIHNKSLQQTLISPFLIISSSYASLSSKNQNNNKDKVDPNDAVTLFNRDPDDPPRLFLVQPRLTPPVFLQAKLNEALCLANSLEEQRDGYFNTDFFDKELPPHVVVQNPALKLGKARADTYFGPGTVETIKCHLNTVESKDEVDAVYVNAILSGVQQRNLERAWGKPVLDRVGLIIEIFNAHAHTKEAKLQAELAALEYKKSRLVRVRGLDGRYTFGAAGEAEVVSARGRGSGGRGFISGAGETELQLQRRRILERRSRLLSQIEEVRRTRAVQRAARRRYGGTHGQALATVAVVGYTNAGKSTLVNALSDSDLYSDARLFATLDPRLKSVILPSGRKVLFSDTVGFISDLPLQLVDAFHATLEEVVEADLLVHVTDCTAPNLEEHRSTVLQVLRQVGVSEEKLQNMVEVYNKIDYHNEEMSGGEYLEDGEDAKFELTDAEAIDDHHSSDEASENNNDVSESLSGDLGETLKKDGGEYSDGWLLSGDEEENMDELWSTSDDKQNELTNNDGRKMEEEEKPECKEGHGPDVKVSALTGVGLQQLLEIIDDRLKIQDDKQKAARVVEKDFFNRKWRPPRNEEAIVAFEQ